MHKNKKKILGILACASVLAGAGAVTGHLINNRAAIVKASSTKVAARSYGIDVSSYQSANLTSMAKAGGQFAIVKVSEGTSYRNPNAASQIKSAMANNMLPMAYHFATFGSNSTAAAKEGKYAVSSAKALGLPSGAYIACDWETGDGNVVTGSKTANTNAILAFMKQVKSAGFQPLLYSGAYLMRNNVNTSTILKSYPNSLWVASYATMGRIDTPNFNYFPSMDGVAIWQFTDNWRGLNVDGNISLLPLAMNQAPSSQAPSSNSATTNINNNASASKNNTTTSSSSEVKTVKKIMHKALIYDQNGKSTGKSLSAYQSITVLGGVVRINSRNFYKIGDNQYVALGNVDGYKVRLKHNAYTYNSKGNRVYVATIKKGSSITVYGSKMKIGSKYYYRINPGRYIKAANVK